MLTSDQHPALLFLIFQGKAIWIDGQKYCRKYPKRKKNEKCYIKTKPNPIKEYNNKINPCSIGNAWHEPFIAFTRAHTAHIIKPPFFSCTLQNIQLFGFSMCDFHLQRVKHKFPICFVLSTIVTIFSMWWYWFYYLFMSYNRYSNETRYRIRFM